VFTVQRRDGRQEGKRMAGSKNTKQTGSSVTKLAAQTLNNKSASHVQKTLAGAALSQAHTGKQTGAATEGIASKALKSPSSAPVTKKLAASVVSQSNRKR
jgi:hypothetical protein